MRVVDLIEKKKQGLAHTKEEINFIVNGFVSGEIEDYQMSAWLMAVCFQDLNIEETAYLTEAFVNSGEILDFSHISDVVADKHSTGGVGDKVTLALIPLLASCGVVCAKLSGRGLGLTGGTIDKLEAIPNFNPQLSAEKFMAQIKKIGCAISSQSPNLTPADGKIYALRDVTATVDNKALICSSVISKKIASGADIIVLDVKYGSGAFIKTKEEAEELATLMIDIAKQLNRKVSAVITSMEQPLGQNIGNALEVIECIEFLKGNMTPDLKEVIFEIALITLLAADKVKTREEGIELLNSKIQSGEALAKLKEIILEQEGNPDCLEDYTKFAQCENKFELYADKSGYIETLEAVEVAKACKLLGAGRDKKTDPIDYAVGAKLNKKAGEKVEKGELLAQLFYNDAKRLDEATEHLKSAYVISQSEVQTEELIYKTII